MGVIATCFGMAIIWLVALVVETLVWPVISRWISSFRLLKTRWRGYI